MPALVVALNFALERCWPLVLWLKAFLTGSKSQPEAAPNIKCPFAKSGAPNPHKSFKSDDGDSDAIAEGHATETKPLLGDTVEGNKLPGSQKDSVLSAIVSDNEKSSTLSTIVSDNEKSSTKPVANSEHGEVPVPQSGDEVASSKLDFPVSGVPLTKRNVVSTGTLSAKHDDKPVEVECKT